MFFCLGFVDNGLRDIYSQSQPSLSQQAGFFHPRRPSNTSPSSRFPQSNTDETKISVSPRFLQSNTDETKFSAISMFPQSNTDETKFSADYSPPRKSLKREEDLIKTDKLSYEDLKREALGGQTEKVGFKSTKVPFMETGCGTTLYKESAFSSKEERNPALTAKIDEDFSSCRAPLEVLKDVMVDTDWCENVDENMKKKHGVTFENF